MNSTVDDISSGGPVAPPGAGAPLLLPLFHDERVEGWPGEHTPVVPYVDVGVLLRTVHASDAHTVAYSVPELPHRLTLDGLGLLAAHEGWRMVLLHLDVDPPRKGEKPVDEAGKEELQQVRESWWQGEQGKLASLEASHPGGFVYRSRSGGYHLVWRLPAPVVIRTHDDKEAWRSRYQRELLYLARTFGILADPRCADITRLFRLPRVTRQLGEAPLSPETRGDPDALGTWSREPLSDELEADVATAQQLAELDPVAWGTVVRRLMPRPPVDTTPPVRATFRGDNSDEARTFKRASAYLATMAPSIEGEGGDAALWLAALSMVRGFALGPETAASLLGQEFNPRCRPSWPRTDIERKCREAAARGEMPWGYLRDASKPYIAHEPRRTTSSATASSAAGTPTVDGSTTGEPSPSSPPEPDDGLGPHWSWAAALGWPDTKPPRRACLLTRPAEGDEDPSFPHDFLPRGKVGMLAAAGGAGKTMALVQLAVSIITGLPWLGYYEVPQEARGPVLLALAEEDAEEAQRRLWVVREHLAMTTEAWHEVLSQLMLLPLSGVDVALVATDRHTRETTRTHVLDGLRRRLDEASVDWRLLVLDPLSRWAGAETEIDNNAATRFVAAIETLTKVRGNPTVMVAHHTSKAARMGNGPIDAAAARGASGLTDGVRWVATLGPHPKLDKLPALSLVKSNYGPPAETRALERGEGGVLSAMSPDEQKERLMRQAETPNRRSSEPRSGRHETSAPSLRPEARSTIGGASLDDLDD